MYGLDNLVESMYDRNKASAVTMVFMTVVFVRLCGGELVTLKNGENMGFIHTITGGEGVGPVKHANNYNGYAERHRTPAPNFLHTPSNVTFHRGELAVLRCSVFNLGTKTVVWRRTDSSFPLTSGTMVVVADDRLQIGHVQYKNQWDLMIKNVQPEDAGIYECQVASRDKTVRRLVQLTVIDPEADIQEIKITEEQYVERGDPIILQCNATGEYYTPDEMDWFRNGHKIDSNIESGIRIFKQFSILKRTISSNLKLDRAKMTDGGTYVCRTSGMQVASTKVHVLNAGTINRKRGALEGEGDGRSGRISALPESGFLVSFSHIHFALLIVTLSLLQVCLL